MKAKTTLRNEGKSTMEVMKVSLPKTLKVKAEALAIANDFPSTSGYVQHLIRSDAERIWQEHKLDRMILEALAEEPITVSSAELKKRVFLRLDAKQKQHAKKKQSGDHARTAS